MSALLSAVAARWGVSAFVLKLILAGILAGGLALGYLSWRNAVWNEGYAAADAMWREKALEAKIEKLEREKAAAEAAEAEAEANAAELERLKNELEKENADYEEQLKARGDRCPLTDDDIKRLRGQQKGGDRRPRHRSSRLAAAI